MLDVAGQDASEAFEDVGHSDEARETLDQLLVGTLKRQVSLLHSATCCAPSNKAPADVPRPLAAGRRPCPQGRPPDFHLERRQFG